MSVRVYLNSDGIGIGIHVSKFFVVMSGYKMCVRVYLNRDGIGKGIHMSKL